MCYKNLSEVNSEPSKASRMEVFAKLVNRFQFLTVFPRGLDVCMGSECASGLRVVYFMYFVSLVISHHIPILR